MKNNNKTSSLKKTLIVGLILALAGIGITSAALANRTDDPGFLKEFAVEQEVENDDFVLTVGNVSLSDAETLIHIGLADKLGGVPRDFIGDPTLRSGDLVLDGAILRVGSAASELAPSGMQELTVRFPALPEDTAEFTFTLPKVLFQTDEGESIAISLPEPLGAAGNMIELDQVVIIQGHKYRFTNVQIVPSGTQTPPYNVSVRYEPVGLEAASNPLSAPLTEFTLSDELGNVYPLALTDSSWDPETVTVQWERFVFRGAPSSEVKTLTLEIDGLGRIVSMPEPAPIVVPTPAVVSVGE